MPSLRERLLELANKACSEEGKLSAPQLKDLLKIALHAARQTKRHAPESVTDNWKPESWSKLKESLSKSTRFSSSTGLHKICDQLVQLVSPEASQGGKKSPGKRKRKAEEELAEAQKEKTKKVKKVKASS